MPEVVQADRPETGRCDGHGKGAGDEVGMDRLAIIPGEDVVLAVVEQLHIQPQSPLDGLFRWEPVGPVVLKAGHEYVMVSSGEGPFDPEVLNPKDASLAPELRYLRYRETEEYGGPRFGYPTRSVSNVLLSGNFKFRPVSTTSPSPTP